MRIVHFFYSHIFISQILYNICNVKYEIFFAADLWKFQSVPEPAPLQGGFGGGGALQDAAAEGAAATSAGDKLSNLEKKIWKNWGKNLEKQYRSDVGWAKSRFTLLKANKSQPNRAKKIGYISNERLDMGVFFRYLVLFFQQNGATPHAARETIEIKCKTILNFFFHFFFYIKSVKIYLKDVESA